ncbi:RNA polymerase sigma factor [bacterium]|nr:RNA polymerase sigma factor [bacterium]
MDFFPESIANELFSPEGAGPDRADWQKFHAFYEQHALQVQNYCVRRGITVEEAREFTQDIFLSVYINRVYNFEEEQAVPWLFTTTRNKVISHMRHNIRKGSHAPVVEEVSRSWNIRYSQPDELIQEKDNLTRLQLIIDNAPPMVRKCLVLKYFHQLSYEEMADFLGLSINTIKTHLKRGLQLLRLQFQEK